MVGYFSLSMLLRLKWHLADSNGVRFDMQANRCLACRQSWEIPEIYGTRPHFTRADEQSGASVNAAGEGVEVCKASRKYTSVTWQARSGLEVFQRPRYRLVMRTIGIVIGFSLGDEASGIAFIADRLRLTGFGSFWVVQKLFTELQIQILVHLKVSFIDS